MQLITVKEMAKRLTVSLSYAYGLLAKGEIPYYAFGSCKRVAEKDLLSYLEQQKQEPARLPPRQRRHF